MDRREFVYGAASTAFASLNASGASSNVAVKLTPLGNESPVMPADLSA
jgi:hypothetical protein